MIGSYTILSLKYLHPVTTGLTLTRELKQCALVIRGESRCWVECRGGGLYLDT